jgi:hypothetical protein
MRWEGYGSGDSQWLQDGDPSFVGIDMLHDRASLGAGMLARAENKRLRDGVASTRPGTRTPSEFNPGFENKIIGSGVYNNPNGDRVLLVAPASTNHVWALQNGKDPIQIPLDTGLDTGTFMVNFVQAFDKVLLLRYPFQSPLVWDGTTSGATAKFVLVTTPGPRTLIPPSIMGVPFNARVLLYNPYYPSAPQRDQVIMTDPLDYTQYDNVLSVFRINAGESDAITSIFGYNRDSVVVFKRNSIHLLMNFSINPLNAGQRVLNAKIGGAGIHAPTQSGGDIMFLSETGGIYKLSEVIQDNVVTDPTPISLPIQPVIDRIDWTRAHLYACSETLGPYSFFALPLDPAADLVANNAVLVFNNESRQWESAPDWWDDAGLRIDRLHTTLFDGKLELFALDYARGNVHLLYKGVEDEIAGDLHPVNDIIETRGYTLGEPSVWKRFARAHIGLRTYDPSASVTAISDGYNEQKSIAKVTKDRRRFYVHGHKLFDPNLDDPTESRREDYSQQDDNFAVEDFEELPEATIRLLPATPIAFNGVKQQTLERFQLRQNGRWCSIQVANESGQCDVIGVSVEGTLAQHATRTLA